MTWWAVCFLAILGTMVGKWYFTRATERLRQSLAHRQRAVQEIKGALTDARVEHQRAVRRCREGKAAIKRLKTQIAEIDSHIKFLKEEAKEKTSRPPRRRS